MAPFKEPVRQDSIVTRVRERIIRGALPPGSRLPTRLAMADEFETTVVTVQRALTRLADDGFVTADGSRGTFVAENPPHLCHYGLVFPYRQKPRDPWSRFLRGVFDAAMQLDQPQSRRLTIYYNNERDIHRTEDYDQLLGDVESHRLAGLIFAQHPFPFGLSPVNTMKGLPRVALISEAWHDVADAVYIDRHSFFDRALDHLQSRGRRRVAMIGTGFVPAERAHFDAAVAARGMAHPAHWLHAVNANDTQWASNLTRLLLHGPASERPDALIIADDNLVEDVSAGVVASGVSVPGELEIVAHCNFPQAPPKVLPIRLLGFDCGRLLRSCIEHIDAVRRGKSVKRATLIAAQFEEEIGLGGRGGLRTERRENEYVEGR